MRPFDYDGAEVTGTANAGSAPTVGSGYWKDTIPATGNESDTLTRYYVVKRSAKQTDIAATALIPSTSHEQETESGKNRQGRAPGGKRLPRQLELGRHQRLLL